MTKYLYNPMTKHYISIQRWIIMAEKEIKVVGMHCPSCVNAVELCLKDVDGIEDAKADLDSGITKITMSDDVSDADINEAVEEAGFTIE